MYLYPDEISAQITGTAIFAIWDTLGNNFEFIELESTKHKHLDMKLE